MALDYLSIPCEYFDPHFNCRLTNCIATSVDVERAFSGGRRLLSFTRNRLSAESIRHLMCLGSWCKNNLVSTNILLKAITARSKRPAESRSPRRRRRSRNNVQSIYIRNFHPYHTRSPRSAVLRSAGGMRGTVQTCTPVGVGCRGVRVRYYSG
jgi:hypothetical protein